MTRKEEVREWLGTNSHPEVWTEEEADFFLKTVKNFDNPACSSIWCDTCTWHDGCNGSLAVI